MLEPSYSAEWTVRPESPISTFSLFMASLDRQTNPLFFSLVTQSKLNGLNEEYQLVKSRVGLAREWLDVDDMDELEEEREPEVTELKMPTKETKTKPKIEIISSIDADEESSAPQSDLERLLNRISELEASGIEMTDEELAEALGVPVPEFAGDLQPFPDQEGMVEITEIEKDDGSVESFVRPKVGAKKQIDSKMKKVVSPMIQERVDEDTRDIVSPMVVDDAPKEEEQPKRVSKFKAMREQNRG